MNLDFNNLIESIDPYIDKMDIGLKDSYLQLKKIILIAKHKNQMFLLRNNETALETLSALSSFINTVEHEKKTLNESGNLSVDRILMDKISEGAEIIRKYNFRTDGRPDGEVIRIVKLLHSIANPFTRADKPANLNQFIKSIIQITGTSYKATKIGEIIESVIQVDEQSVERVKN